MIKHTFISVASVLALGAAAGPASAADPVVVPMSPAADVQRMTALDGTIVWVDAGSKLMQRTPDGVVQRVPGAQITGYRSIDLGLNAAGETVLTYVRCGGPEGCQPISDDLAGHRVRFKRLAPKGCTVTSAPARWRERVAYGLRCAKPSGAFDAARSGFFIRRGAAAPTRLRLPRGVQAGERYTVETADLRGARAAALVADGEGFASAVVQTIRGTHPRTAYVAGGGEEARDWAGGVSLGTGGRLWSLSYGYDSSDSHSIIHRIGAGCAAHERLPDTPTSSQDGNPPATSMAVDGSEIYVFARGEGIVAHAFSPQACD